MAIMIGWNLSASMLILFLRDLGAKVDYFIPDRFSDGYGISTKSITEASKKIPMY